MRETQINLNLNTFVENNLLLPLYDAVIKASCPNRLFHITLRINEDLRFSKTRANKTEQYYLWTKPNTHRYRQQNRNNVHALFWSTSIRKRSNIKTAETLLTKRQSNYRFIHIISSWKNPRSNDCVKYCIDDKI